MSEENASKEVENLLEPVWIVNDLGELGVKVNGRFFFLYKGDNIEYGKQPDEVQDGVAVHGDLTPMRYRIVGKREFGETCWPVAWVERGYRERRYTEDLQWIKGVSDGRPEDGHWRDLPAKPQMTEMDKIFQRQREMREMLDRRSEQKATRLDDLPDQWPDGSNYRGGD